MSTLSAPGVGWDRDLAEVTLFPGGGGLFTYSRSQGVKGGLDLSPGLSCPAPGPFLVCVDILVPLGGPVPHSPSLGASESPLELPCVSSCCVSHDATCTGLNGNSTSKTVIVATLFSSFIAGVVSGFV